MIGRCIGIICEMRGLASILKRTLMLLNVKSFVKVMMNVIIGLSNITGENVSSKMLMLCQPFLKEVALHLGLKFVVNYLKKN